jgi:hypothetical protein
MVSDVHPLEVALSVAILLVTIGRGRRGTVRIYATGVLLYGSGPASAASSRRRAAPDAGRRPRR